MYKYIKNVVVDSLWHDLNNYYGESIDKPCSTFYQRQHWFPFFQSAAVPFQLAVEFDENNWNQSKQVGLDQ